ncbi:drug resistance transporter, EmrB/QacA subfamily [Streptomyces sp. DvalAA-14]|uniref:MFS transporter n=1 Tax=unclassified Streptomyces TaxID=2593676 RepID=UPI00081BB0BD|nr:MULTISPECIES: MFS transporter [unclassified Streptomyces]MYS22218.1 DHA2 family efflux MFS transporter permease subunit [Streptomyces sp. SID4948]SCE11419.1 drug resistance transporter, EmrB/QacA subfamily [Streptomyces sp. DvalAA-14]
MRKWLPLVAICLGAFILLVDVTIVNVALPRMADDLNASFASLQWVIDIYALALAALLMVTGSLADLFGHRRLYATGLVVFALASLACALAPNAAVLITARAVQGAGGAAMFATSAALVSATYQGRDRGVAFGVWGAVNGAAAAAGPIVGGLLTEGFGWQAIFLVNLPIAVVAVALTLRVLPAQEGGGRGGARLDLPGAATFTLAAASLTYALIRGGEHGWGDRLTIAAFVVAGLSAVGFVAVEARSAHPMLDLALLRRPTFAGLLTGALLYQMAAFSGLVYVSLWLQNVLGLSPVHGGLALMPMAGTAFVVAAVAGRHMHRFAPRVPIGGGLLLIAAGSLLIWATVDTGSGQSALFAGLAVIGVGVGLSTPVLVSAAIDSVPPARAGMAGGAVNTFRQLGMTLGIALFGAVFTARLRDVAASGGTVHAGYAAGIDRISLLAAAAALAGAILVLTLVRRPAPAAAAASAAPDTTVSALPSSRV